MDTHDALETDTMRSFTKSEMGEVCVSSYGLRYSGAKG